ncbi:MAG: APC family permease [Coriobacteriia bacterium]|nr:APC family permease [Coriobacteriia bacterium]
MKGRQKALEPDAEGLITRRRLGRLKSSLLGRRLGDADQGSQRFSVFWGLPILSSDAISSVAYAIEEILLVLVPVLALTSFTPLLWVSGLIIVLAMILAICYRQTVDIYPEGGGAYSVARDNFGRVPSLVAGGSLMVGYILTVAVSSAAGSSAIVSAFPALSPYIVPMTIFFILLMTFGNLRGLREASHMFGIPTYFFIVSMLIMIVVGLVKGALGYAPADLHATFAQPTQDLTLFLFLRAFSSGCSALTGVEAVSNSVPNFRAPSQANAKRALILMALIIMVIMGGSTVVVGMYHIVPSENMTVLSQAAAAVFGSGNFMFFILQAATAIILFMAANTSYNGLPALMSLMASHNYLPHYFANKGSRLVFSSGIIFIAVCAILLELIFQADTHNLIPLYAIGVFLSFTIAQAGMFKHWLTTRGNRWQRKATINGIGAVITATATLVIGITRFTQGAWIALVVITILTLGMLAIYRHYSQVEKDLHITSPQFLHGVRHDVSHNRIILPIRDISRSFLKSLNYAIGLGGDIEIFHVSVNAAQTKALKTKYKKLGLEFPLVIEPTPYRNVNEVLLNHVDSVHKGLQAGETLTIIMPQLIVRHWWQNILHNQTSLTLELSLLGRRNITIAMIPFIANLDWKPGKKRSKKKKPPPSTAKPPESES